MRGGFVQFALLEKAIAQVVVDGGVIRLYFQGLFIFRDGLVVRARRGQSFAQVVEDVRIIWR